MSVDANRVLKPFRQVRKALKRFPKNPLPAQIHKFRTNLRRIEAILDALDWQAKPTGRRLLREEEPLRRRAGKVRDMDVLTGLAAATETGKDDECRLELIEFLGAERYGQAKKMHQVAQSSKKSFRKQLKRCLQTIDQQVGESAPADAKAMTASTVAARTLQLCTGLSQFPPLNRRNLHEFRLQVKPVRYMLELATDSDAHLIEALGEVKDKIGEWHDWQELTAQAKDNIVAKPDVPLLRALKETTEKKFDEAMQAAEQLRRTHLAAFRPVRKRAARQVGPVLVTSSFLAA
jgi:CHAD domain-containing protein